MAPRLHDVEVLELGRRRQHHVGVAGRVGHELLGHDREQVLAGQPGQDGAGVGVHDRGVGVGDAQRGDRAAVVVRAGQRPPELHLVDDPGRVAVGAEVRSLHGRAPVGEGPGAVDVGAAARVAPRAGDGGQAEDGSERLAGVGVALGARAELDEGRPGRRQPAGEVRDGVGRQARGPGGARHRPLHGAGPELVRADGPLGQELGVLQPLGEDDVEQPECERTVTAGPRGEVEVGRSRRLGPDGVDADDGPAPLPGLQEVGPEVEVGGDHVGPPRHHELGLGHGLDVRRRPTVRVGEAPRPRAGGEADRAVHARRAEGVEQPAVDRRALQLAHRAHVREGEDGRRTVPLDRALQAGPHGGQRLGPAHLPERAGALRPGADERDQEPVGVVGALLVPLHLHAQVAHGDRVIAVAVDAGDHAVVDLRRPRAGVGAVVRAGPPYMDRRHRPSPFRTPDYSGVLSCLRGRRSSRLVASMRRARLISRRVSLGSITAST